jgi:hypothetical protein
MVLGFVNNIYEAKAHFLLCFFKTHLKFYIKTINSYYYSNKTLPNTNPSLKKLNLCDYICE